MKLKLPNDQNIYVAIGIGIAGALTCKIFEGKKDEKPKEKPKEEIPTYTFFSDEEIKERLSIIKKSLDIDEDFKTNKPIHPNFTILDVTPQNGKYNFSKFIDHTVLSAFATKFDVRQICEDAIIHQFAAVCVNPSRVEFCNKYFESQIEAKNIGIAVVVGFPLGATSTESKVAETVDCVKKGATEIDMVINVGRIKEGDYVYVFNDIKKIKEACGEKVSLKVIIECAYLSDEEKVDACIISVLAGADYVKTSTGFATLKNNKPVGAVLEDVKLMRRTVDIVSGEKNLIGVKAAGGIRNYEDTKKFIEAGANRIGASASLAIVS